MVHSGSRGLGAAIAEHHARVATAGHRRGRLQGLDTTEELGAAYLHMLGVALEPEEVVDIHHNFVAREKWFGKELLVHRKGAVAVPLGAKAVIPGSMGTASYIVEGHGNPHAFGSCSHGAGRVMSRKEARRAIKPQALAQAMRRVVYPKHLERSLVEERAPLRIATSRRSSTPSKTS